MTAPCWERGALQWLDLDARPRVPPGWIWGAGRVFGGTTCNALCFGVGGGVAMLRMQGGVYNSCN